MKTILTIACLILFAFATNDVSAQLLFNNQTSVSTGTISVSSTTCPYSGPVYNTPSSGTWDVLTGCSPACTDIITITTSLGTVNLSLANHTQTISGVTFAVAYLVGCGGYVSLAITQ